MTTDKPNNLAKINPTSVSEVITANTWKKHKPRAKEFFIRCEEIRGFYIRKLPKSNRNPQGISTYYVNGRFAGTGKQIYPKVGDCSILPFDKAVDLAKQYLYQISMGIDPRLAEKKEKAFSITLADAIQEYADAIKTNIVESTYNDYLRKGRLQLKSLSKKSIGEITVDDVKQWWMKGKKDDSMRNALTYASKVLDDYVGEEYIEVNPFRKAKLLARVSKTIKQRSETSQHIPMDRLSSYVGSMFNVWDKQGKTLRDLVLFVLLTGKRIDEASQLTWNNVDFKRGKFVLPVFTTKGDSPEEVVPTTPYINRILKYRQEHCKAEGNPYVFNSVRTQDISKQSYSSDTRKVLQAIWKGIPEDERPPLTKEGSSYIANHDLRRTFSTASGELGYSMEDTKSLLGHKKQDITDKYTQRSLEYSRSKLMTVQHYLNAQSHDGIHALLVKFYGANEQHLSMADEGAIKETNYEKEWEDF